MRPANLRKQCRGGQALIEFALVLPLLAWLMINVVNFGGLLYAWIMVSNAARTGAQYFLQGSSYATSPSQATAAQVSALVNQDLISLPNRASVSVKVCTNNNGTIACSPSGTITVADPEPGFYVLGTVDVTYTYQPFISFWTFSKLGISLTLGQTTVHRQAVVRMV